MDIQAIEAARTEVDRAICEYTREVHGTPFATDWVAFVEIHKEGQPPEIIFADSHNMTPWKRNGLVRWVASAFGIKLL